MVKAHCCVTWTDSPCRVGMPGSDTSCWRSGTAIDGWTTTMPESFAFWNNRKPGVMAGIYTFRCQVTCSYPSTVLRSKARSEIVPNCLASLEMEFLWVPPAVVTTSSWGTSLPCTNSCNCNKTERQVRELELSLAQRPKHFLHPNLQCRRWRTFTPLCADKSAPSWRWSYPLSDLGCASVWGPGQKQTGFNDMLKIRWCLCALPFTKGLVNPDVKLTSHIINANICW